MLWQAQRCQLDDTTECLQYRMDITVITFQQIIQQQYHTDLILRLPSRNTNPQIIRLHPNRLTHTVLHQHRMHSLVYTLQLPLANLVHLAQIPINSYQYHHVLDVGLVDGQGCGLGVGDLGGDRGAGEETGQEG